MSIGATLASARRRAGRSVGDVSSETRIRETIIRGIERDDYGQCGGDFYARGHIRSIARAVGFDPEPLLEEYDATQRVDDDAAAADAAFLPAAAVAAPRRHRKDWAAGMIALAILGLIGVVGFLLVRKAHPGAHATATGASSAPAHQRSAGASPQAAGASPAAHSGRPPPSASGRAPAGPVVAGAPPVLLTPVSVQAFGPAGPGQGDDPQRAPLALHGSPANAWHTSWYATAQFGNLQSGTGLLMDMGHPVTITSAQLRLGSTPGTDLQVRTGAVPALTRLHQVAAATGAGGLVQLRPSAPTRARYVLIWFTRLPPDNAGTFRLSVYRIRLHGRR
jgi:cytoskeletal protein RodZ